MPKFHAYNTVPSMYPDSEVVYTKSGPIIGRRLIYEGEKQVNGFQGIPYARPPIGELRFTRSEPSESWSDVKETRAFGTRSMQFEFSKERSEGQGIVSEDCLFLNVISPVWEPSDAKGFPVLVFIHGGGYHSGSPVRNGDVTIAEHLVKKDVIVVTVNYRLGFLGFWTTGDENCRGNWGLWDLNLALQWIQDNISLFNGDPTNVTLLGQSAGAALVDFLSLSPYSRDKFQKMILLSGTTHCEMWPMVSDVIGNCSAKAKRMGIEETQSEKIIEKLRSMPAESFPKPDDFTKPTVEDFCLAPVSPVIDGDFLPKPLSELRLEAPPKPRIVGCCKAEGLMFYLLLKLEGKSSLDLIEQHINCLFNERNCPNDYERARDEYRTLLLGDSPEHLTQTELEEALVQIIGDRYETAGIQRDVMENVHHSNTKAYMFSFDYSRPETLGLLKDYPCAGPTHSMDMAFIFGVAGVYPFEYTEEDKKMLHIHTTYLTNFAKFGNPNGLNDSLVVTEWIAASTEHPQRHLKINLPPAMNDIFVNGRAALHAINTSNH